MTNEVTKAVNEDWNMKRFKINHQTGTKAITKDTAHILMEKRRRRLSRRGVLLAIINKLDAKNSLVAMEAAQRLRLAQDNLFNIWQTVEPDKSKWQDLSENNTQGSRSLL